MSGMPSLLSMYDGVQEIGKVIFFNCWGQGIGKGDWVDVLPPGQPQGSQDPENLFKIP